MNKVFIILTALLLCSCDFSEEQQKQFIEQESKMIGHTDQWKMYRVNDTIVVCLPYCNADDNLQPVVVNLKDVTQ